MVMMRGGKRPRKPSRSRSEVECAVPLFHSGSWSRLSPRASCGN